MSQQSSPEPDNHDTGKLLAEIATELPERHVRLPDESVLKETVIETTEQQVARLLKLADGSIEDLKTFDHGEIEHLSRLIEGRAGAWERVAERFQVRVNQMHHEAERLRKLASDLAALTVGLAELQNEKR